MLPGFRFLFAAVMLSMSLLVFGLGAAALLRAAHEFFASNSSWRGAPEVTFVQHTEPTMPMLAALRVDTVAEKAPDPAKAVAAPAEPVPAPAASVSIPQVAALSPAETPAIDTSKPDAALAQMPVAETLPAPEAAPAPETVATSDATKTAASTDEKTAVVVASNASSDHSAPVMPRPAPAVAPPADPATAVSTTAAASTTSAVSVPTTPPGASIAATKIATLGGQPVDIAPGKRAKEKSAKPEHAKDDPSAVEKRVHARRIARRRRLAARARLAAQQLLLQQANPFAQPVVPTATATRQQRQ